MEGSKAGKNVRKAFAVKKGQRHLVCLEQGRPRGNLVALCNVLSRGSAEGGAHLCSLMGMAKSCASRGFRPDIRKNLFTVVRHWNRLPREVIAAPCLSVFKRCLGNYLINML